MFDIHDIFTEPVPQIQGFYNWGFSIDLPKSCHNRISWIINQCLAANVALHY